MISMTATEVSRNFASVLDRAARGETIVITRSGRRLATLAPATAGNGAAVKEFLALHAPDDGFAGDIADTRELLGGDVSSAWPDV